MVEFILKYPTRVFFGVVALAVALNFGTGLLCLLTERSRTQAAVSSANALREKRSRDCVVMLSSELQNFLSNADAIPVPEKEYKKLSSEFLANVQDYATLAFWFLVHTNPVKKSYGICAQNGLDNGYFRAVERFGKDAEKIFTYAELRVGANRIPWMDTYLRYINNRNLYKQTTWNTPGELKSWYSGWDYGIDEIGNPSASSFRFEIFQDRLFLVRKLHAPSVEKFVQGFLLNEEKLLFVLLTKVRRELPNATLEFCADAANADISPCGLPMKFSAGTLPEEIALRAELRNFRILLAGAWLLGVVASAGTLAALRFVQRTAERRRIFVASVVHDLRSPVAEINALAENISKSPEEKPLRSRNLRQLAGRVRDLSALLDNSLLFSRISGAKRDVLNFRDARFGEIFPTIAESITERLDRAGSDFDTEISSEAENSLLHISPAALERILFNLADNAAKYASGGNAPLFSLSAELANGGKILKIRAADNGGGLSEKARKNLFREFSHSAQESTESGVRGLGIGLALSKKLALLLGGDLRLEKSDATGTAFILTLPVK
ncbi:MAG: HAMP domain-containing histidine kinase [Opitutales bacterium]|nr:HAMP domain-containing histidine kinase [Opitutales bacterium]